MKNKSGFTLVELLAVIAILGILAVVSVTAVGGTLKNSNDKTNKIQEELIKDAAKAYAADNINLCKEAGCNVTIQNLVDNGYLESDKNVPDGTVYIQKRGNNYTYDISINDVNIGTGRTFSYTGSPQTYSVPMTGTCTIEVAGAQGTGGNTHSYTSAGLPKGGKGAYLSSSFNLKKGDILTLVVGGQGNTTQATAKDGTSGAGGGGTFIFKEISSITNSNYQFTKGSKNYEVLLVAAGGGGSNDASYQGTIYDGYDGIGNTWYSPSNFTAYNTEATVGPNNSALGISQFITYNLQGSSYSRNNGECTGGFGGGGCADDARSYGGGWSGASYQAYSFSSGNNTSGTTGSRSGNGYAKISCK